MKSLAGANPDAKPDYRAQSLTELNKLEQKVILLNEMLDNVDPSRGEKFVEGDAYDVSFPSTSSSSNLIGRTASIRHSESCKAQDSEMDI